MRITISFVFIFLLGCVPENKEEPSHAITPDRQALKNKAIAESKPQLNQVGGPGNKTLTVTDSTCPCWTKGDTRSLIYDPVGKFWTCTFGPQKGCTATTELRMIILQPSNIPVMSIYSNGILICSTPQLLPQSTPNRMIFQNLMTPPGYGSCGSLSDTINVIVTP